MHRDRVLIMGGMQPHNEVTCSKSPEDNTQKATEKNIEARVRADTLTAASHYHSIKKNAQLDKPLPV